MNALYPPCNAGLPNVFTSVAHFLTNQWIQSNSNYDATADFHCFNNCDMHSCDNDNDNSTNSPITTNAPTEPPTTTQEPDFENAGFWESSHPYENAMSLEWNKSPPSGKFLKLWFSSFATEKYWDGLAIKCNGYTDAFSGNDGHISTTSQRPKPANSDAFLNRYGQNYLDTRTYSKCTGMQVDFHFMSEAFGQDHGYKLNWQIFDDVDCETPTDNDETTQNPVTTQEATTSTESDDSCCQFGERCVALAEHNTLRSGHADTPCMSMTESMNSGAQFWADRLAEFGSFEHSTGSGYGENIYAAYKQPGPASGSIEEQAWILKALRRRVSVPRPNHGTVKFLSGTSTIVV